MLAKALLSLTTLTFAVTAQVVFTGYASDDTCTDASSTTTLVSKQCVDFPTQLESFSYTGGSAALEAVIYAEPGCAGAGSTVHLDDNNDCQPVDAFFPPGGPQATSIGSVCLSCN